MTCRHVLMETEHYLAQQLLMARMTSAMEDNQIKCLMAELEDDYTGDPVGSGAAQSAEARRILETKLKERDEARARFCKQVI